MGPLDPFIAACESILWHVEGIDSSLEDIDGKLILGSKEGSRRWQTIAAGEKAITSSQDVISQIVSREISFGGWQTKSMSIESKIIHHPGA